ncbi:fungal-specific transcription factor domain-containing protein [Lipomyces tetrasporus]
MAATTNGNRTYSRQNRPVTACVECHRRKQRCDRKFPCQNCIVRDVGKKCSYRTSNATDGLRASGRHSQSNHGFYSPQDVDRQDSHRLEESSLSKHIGYSQRSSTCILSTLTQLFEDDESPQPVARTLEHSMNRSKWTGFGKLINKLPSVSVAQQLVQVFFNEANWYFAVLDQYYFDRLHITWIAFVPSLSNAEDTSLMSLDLLYFPALLFQVLALALQFIPPGMSCGISLGAEDPTACDQLSKKFSDTGVAIIDLLGRQTPTITAVQADLLRCAWLKNSGQGTESWYSLGNAIRQAQELGLHLQADRAEDDRDDMGETLKALWYDEHRKRLWATLFSWESHMALTLGRPRMINAIDCTVTAPIDCDFPLEPARTMFTPTGSNDRPSSYTLQLVKYEVAQKIHRMMSIGATNSRLRDYRVIQTFHDEIVELLNGLPPAMRLETPDLSWDLQCPDLVKQRLQISIVANSFLMALHRPHASGNVTSRQSAIEAALQVLDASHQLFERSQKHHHKIYTLVFHTIDAGIFLSAAARLPAIASGIRGPIYRTLDQAVARLRVLKERNSAAYFGEQVLMRCFQKLRQSSKNQGDVVAQLLQSEQLHRGGGYDPTLGRAADNDQVNEMFTSDHGPALRDSEVNAALDYDPWNGRDRFAEVTNARVHTAVWLEHMDMMSSLDFGVQDNDFAWDTLFQ